MRYRKAHILLMFLFGFVLCLTSVRGAMAQDEVAASAAQPAEIESVIKTLEDPVAREKLVRQLKILVRAQQPKAPESQVKSMASEALLDISRRLRKISTSVLVLADNINEIPRGFSWFKAELADPRSRQVWAEILINLTLTLGLGYLAFYLMRWGLLRFRRAAAEKQPSNYLMRAVQLLGNFILDLLPILAFAVTAYLTLSLVGPQDKTSMVALAWINAFIIAHGILALCHLVFTPSAPGLRWSGLSDETANYLMIWGKRLSYVTVYGYFALQAALLLGLPPISYEVLLRLLGLQVTLLIIVMILQNRERVTRFLQGPDEECAKTINCLTPHGVRNLLAQIWHLLALFNVVLLYGVWALQVKGGFVFLAQATLLTLVVLLLIRLALRLLEAVFTHGSRISEDLKNRFPYLEERTNRYLHTLHRGLNVAVYVLGSMSILQAWGVDTFGWLASKPGKILGGTLMTIFGILLAAFLIWEITNSLIEGYLTRKDKSGLDLEASPRTRTLLDVARKALTIVLTVVASLMILPELGVDIAPLLAGAGVLGLAVGFGSQKLVQDVITGVFILLEDQIAVGDVINVGDKGGVVEAVSIRTVRLRDLAGTVHTIPFSAISIVSNLTKDFSYHVIEVGIAYREDVDEVMQVLQDLGAELQQYEEFGPKIIESLEMLGVDAFADSAVVIKARIKTVPSKQWWVGREFNRRMKRRFDELGIEIPFPHTTIYYGENKEGATPPARLQVEHAGPAGQPVD